MAEGVARASRELARLRPVVRRPGLVVAAAGIACGAWYAFVLLRRSDMLLVPAYDLAFFQNVAWNVARGRGFTTAYWPADFLGLHFSPLLALVAVPELVWPDARLLSLLQATAIGSAGPAAYLVLRALLPEGAGPRLVAAALAAPLPVWALLQQAAIADFHPEAIALPLVLLAAWAGLTGRHAAMAALGVAALCAREDEAYAVLLVGLAVAARGRPRAGLGLAALAAAWAVVVVGIAMPALRGSTPSQVSGYYDWLRGAGPGAVAAALASPAGWLALAVAVASAAGLPLLGWRWLLLAAPPFLADLLSRHDPQPALHLQYGLPVVVPLLIAAGFGARAALERGWAPVTTRAWLLALPALALAALGPPGARGWTPREAPAGALAELRSCVAALPAGAPVAADDSVAVPLASRPVLVSLDRASTGTWVVVDRAGSLPAYVDRERRARVLQALPHQGRRQECAANPRFELWTPSSGGKDQAGA